MDFLNDEHFLRWAKKFGSCRNGCWTKECENKKVEVNNKTIQVKEYEVK